MKHNKINTASSFLPAPESWPGVFLDPVLGLGVAVAVVVSVVGGVVRDVVIGVVVGVVIGVVVGVVIDVIGVGAFSVLVRFSVLVGYFCTFGFFCCRTLRRTCVHIFLTIWICHGSHLPLESQLTYTGWRLRVELHSLYRTLCIGCYFHLLD